MKTPPIRYVGDKRVRELLEQYACPTPFHAVRTRFLGNFATPRLDVSPIEAIMELWGDELPEFEVTDEVNELFHGLFSFWNHLSKHQSRKEPFRLLRESSKPVHDDLARLCQTRIEEIEGFISGLFGDEEIVDLPERAARGMDQSAETIALMHGVLRLLEDPDRSTSRQELQGTLRNMKELTQIAEKEIHAVVLSCVRARREAMGHRRR